MIRRRRQSGFKECLKCFEPFRGFRVCGPLQFVRLVESSFFILIVLVTQLHVNSRVN